MPINIPDDLPARQILEHEGVLVIREHEAIRQDIRPMRIALLNLMPEKIKTETQIARVVGSTPLQVEMTLLKTSSYTPTTTPLGHMLAFYVPWTAVADEKFDGLIVTGAPVEEMEFEDVDYWVELTEIFDWAPRFRPTKAADGTADSQRGSDRMPINIPDDLPARQILEHEGVLVIREHQAVRQDIRPMRIALLNLMPEKIKTETQIARVVGSTPLMQRKPVGRWNGHGAKLKASKAG